MNSKTSQKTTTIPQAKRLYAEDRVIDSDTFKLELANYAKNLSFDDKRPIIVGVEHCHWYHSYDSNGKAMTKCNAVGGHYHEMETSLDDQGNILGVCGPAISKRGDDKHIHEVTYIKSDKFKVRTMNEKAAAVIAGLAK